MRSDDMQRLLTVFVFVANIGASQHESQRAFHLMRPANPQLYFAMKTRTAAVMADAFILPVWQDDAVIATDSVGGMSP